MVLGLILLCLPAYRNFSLRGTPAFYFLLPLFIGITTLFFLPAETGFSNHQGVASTVAALYWLAGGIAFLLLRNSVNRASVKPVLELWFGLNAVVSLGQLIYTIWLAGGNPYQSPNYLLGNSTGDWIKGVLLGPCYLNAFVSAFFVFYFLVQKKGTPAFLASAILCLTSSNFVNLAFLPLLWFFALLHRHARWNVMAQTAFFVLFYVGLASGNLQYLSSSLKKVLSPNSISEQPLAPVASRPSGATRQEDSLFQNVVMQPAGKLVAFKMTGAYLLSGVQPFLIGAGAGNFSSQLALRLTDGAVPTGSRLFQKLPRHTAQAYRQNHLRLYEIIYAMPMEYHSIQHLPGSFLNQLFGEYGVIGFLIFLLGYVFFFFKRWRQLSWSRYVLLLAGAFLFFDYGFEYLSVMVFAELFFLEDLRRHPEALLQSPPTSALV